MVEVFGPGGLLEKCMPEGYEHRPSQLEMAERVDEAFRTRQHLLRWRQAPAPAKPSPIWCLRFGVAYVESSFPRRRNPCKEQLFAKDDIPVLTCKHLAPDLKVAVMKGRANFLCRQRVHQMEDQPVLRGMEELDWFTQIRDWERLTETGDRAELTFLPDDNELWARLDARRETCTGQKCPEFQRCFVTAMHQRAAEADLIIVNHHLFFADLALRQDDFGSILPEYSAVVFDEAHEIEDVASDYFGRVVSTYRFEELARDAEQALRLTQQGGPSLLRRVTRLRQRTHDFFDTFRDAAGPARRSDPGGPRSVSGSRNRKGYDELIAALRGLEADIAILPGRAEELVAIARRSRRTPRRTFLPARVRTRKNYAFIGSNAGTKASSLRPPRLDYRQQDSTGGAPLLTSSTRSSSLPPRSPWPAVSIF